VLISRVRENKIRSVRVPDDLWNSAKAKALAEYTTLSAVIVQALLKYVEES